MFCNRPLDAFPCPYFMSLFYVPILLTRLVHERLKMAVLDHERSDRAAEAVMDALRQAIVLPRRIEIEGALVGPVAHDRQTIEQRDTALLSHGAHLVHVRTD